MVMLIALASGPLSADDGSEEPRSAGLLPSDAVVSHPAPYLSTSDGRDETYALARSYPHRIETIEYRNGDWSVAIEGRWFRWANGRMLPDAVDDDWEQYISYWLYDYPIDDFTFRLLNDEEAKRVMEIIHELETEPFVRAETFLSTLLEAANREQTENQLVRIEFLQFKFRTHRLLSEPLKRIEDELLRLMSRDESVERFFRGINVVQSYNYRTIAGQNSRSYHSYGTAIDFVPYFYDGKFPYWLWAYESGQERWWEIPFEERWMVPDEIVRAFERHGFIWGGKWLFFDTIHFEYRPEILLMSRLDRF